MLYEGRGGSDMRFYKSKGWLNQRREILTGVCFVGQICKQRGRYCRANTVHHVKPLKGYPELALADWYEDDTGRHRQLISLCRDCHEAVHDNRIRIEPITLEQW